MCSIILIYVSFISAIYDKAKRLIVLCNWKYSTDIRYKMTAQNKNYYFFKIEHAPFTIIFFGRSTKEA